MNDYWNMSSVASTSIPSKPPLNTRKPSTIHLLSSSAYKCFKMWSYLYLTYWMRCTRFHLWVIYQSQIIPSSALPSIRYSVYSLSIKYSSIQYVARIFLNPTTCIALLEHLLHQTLLFNTRSFAAQLMHSPVGLQFIFPLVLSLLVFTHASFASAWMITRRINPWIIFCFLYYKDGFCLLQTNNTTQMTSLFHFYRRWQVGVKSSSVLCDDQVESGFRSLGNNSI